MIANLFDIVKRYCVDIETKQNLIAEGDACKTLSVVEVFAVIHTPHTAYQNVDFSFAFKARQQNGKPVVVFHLRVFVAVIGLFELSVNKQIGVVVNALHTELARLISAFHSNRIQNTAEILPEIFHAFGRCNTVLFCNRV